MCARESVRRVCWPGRPSLSLICLRPMLGCTIDYKCKVTVDVYKETRRSRPLWKLTERPVPKNHSLRFRVDTNVPPPYEVQWQVINTGQEATTVGDPRGSFYPSNDGVRGR